jgi:hypothetical protein
LTTWSIDGLVLSRGMMAATTEARESGQLARVASLMVAAWLAGCAVAPEQVATPPVVARPAEPQTTALPPPPPRPIRKPAPPPASAPGASVTPDDRSPEPVAPPQPVDPERVIGLDETGAATWLGEPSQKSEAAPATIWRYQSRDCEVDIYFYLDLQNRVMRALHYEVRSNDIVDRRSERCFQQLVDERREREGRTSSAYHPR